MKERGVTVVLITHKLREIMAATDRVFVMRQGQMVAERRTHETDPEELAELMVGRKVRLGLDKAPRHPGAGLYFEGVERAGLCRTATGRSSSAIARVLAWSPDGSHALVVGSQGFARGIYLLDTAAGDGLDTSKHQRNQ